MTVGKGTAQIAVYLVVIWLCGRIFGVLGLSHEAALLITCLAIRFVSMIGTGRKDQVPEDVSFGLTDLWFFTFLVLLAVIVGTIRDHRSWHFAVVLSLVVVGLGVLVELRRRFPGQSVDEARPPLADPQVDDVR
ncbi:MAG: hypothetical protein ACYC61_02080 [Isosphaeraceae bacterium]